MSKKWSTFDQKWIEVRPIELQLRLVLDQLGPQKKTVNKLIVTMAHGIVGQRREARRIDCIRGLVEDTKSLICEM